MSTCLGMLWLFFLLLSGLAVLLARLVYGSCSNTLRGPLGLAELFFGFFNVLVLSLPFRAPLSCPIPRRSSVFNLIARLV